MSDELDFHLDDFEPADTDSEDAEQRFWHSDLTVLAEHHTTPYGPHSFVVAHDRSATWGVPGAPQIAAIKVARDFSRRTFTFEAAYHAAVPFAQNWLIEHGCPPDRIAQVRRHFMEPTDDLTLLLDRQIRESGARYEVIGSGTSDSDPCETWTLTRDSRAAQAPIRVFLEEDNREARTYTIREGAFDDEAAARHWLADRSSPLPQPPDYRGEAAARLARAALYRSAGASAIPKAGPDIRHAPSAGAAQRPNRGKSL
ncbi:glycosyl hydrolase [Streptomyces gibsoniae]|uniref:Glycosyl hydrolase n=1 Tax=Streptomyces gibsoniae TaxID=3075529 RepID=A0ABU2TUX9_9ACTN|nr:glycosyl hydrolase [Streptomyces sp. DSM 41699]MDT0464766.1 glycosyl hydrolase [Streptomyces sp. DSM 41699]